MDALNISGNIAGEVLPEHEKTLRTGWLQGWRDLSRRQDLLARSDRSSQTAVVHTVSGVPQRLAQLNATTQYLNFVCTSGRGVRGHEFFILLRHEVFIVSVP